jgi:hypothetical protein
MTLSTHFIEKTANDKRCSKAIKHSSDSHLILNWSCTKCIMNVRATKKICFKCNFWLISILKFGSLFTYPIQVNGYTSVIHCFHLPSWNFEFVVEQKFKMKYFLTITLIVLLQICLCHAGSFRKYQEQKIHSKSWLIRNSIPSIR